MRNNVYHIYNKIGVSLMYAKSIEIPGVIITIWIQFFIIF